MNIEAKVLQTIAEYGMIERGEKVLAAVSGGADSVCMLYVLNKIKKSLGFELYCAHVNHGLRGESADNDETFVRDFCNKLGVAFFVKSLERTPRHNYFSTDFKFLRITFSM